KEGILNERPNSALKTDPGRAWFAGVQCSSVAPASVRGVRLPPIWQTFLNRGRHMRVSQDFLARLPLALLLISAAVVGPVLPESPGDRPWVHVPEDERAIKIETDKLEAVIPKKNPKRWMTGIEKQSFLDKTTGCREAGDGLMVVDWLMEAGSDEAYADKILP